MSVSATSSDLCFTSVDSAKPLFAQRLSIWPTRRDQRAA